MRVLLRLLAVLLTFAAVSGGLLYGRALGARGQGQAARHRVGKLFTFPRRDQAEASSPIQQADESVPPVYVFEDVLDHVQKEFVENNSTNTARLNNGSLARMFASLDDPHTFYLDHQLRRARQDALQGRFHGIGAVLTVARTRRADVEYRRLTVVDSMPGSPAEKAGLRSGDSIVEVNGHWIIAYNPLVDEERVANKKEDEPTRRTELQAVKGRFLRGYSLSTALPLLSEGTGNPLELTVARAGIADPIKLSLTTSETKVTPVEFRLLANGVGYLRIRQFNLAAETRLKEALRTPNPAMHGIIVDLRGCPGGVSSDADTATDGMGALRILLQSLSPGGNAGLLERRPAQGKTPAVREILTVAKGGLTRPLAVLVDRGTANLAEMAAVGLRSCGGAKVVGSHTFGDETLAFFAFLHGDGAVEMSYAHLFTAAGISLKGGIEPTIPVQTTAQTGDAAMRRAVSLLEGIGG